MEDIELVIKISEEKYDTIKSDLYNTFPAEMKEWGLEAIRNGTPLPKGHGKLIDENYLLNFLKCEEYKSCVWKDCTHCIQENCIRTHNILDAPAIIEADK